MNPISQYYEMKLGNEQTEKASWQEIIHKINQEIAQKSSKMLNFNHMKKFSNRWENIMKRTYDPTAWCFQQ